MVFDFCAFDAGIQIAAGTPGSCQNIGSVPLDGSNFIDITDGLGSIVCSVNPNGNNLGSTLVELFTTNDDREVGEVIMMRRDFSLSPANQPGSPVTLRFYYTAAEIAALIAANPEVNSIADLAYTKSVGGCTGNPSPGDVIFQTASGPFGDDGDVFVDIQVSTFSSFFGHAQSQALPVELIYFDAKAFENNIQLEWETASEKENEGFAIEKRINGKWREIGFVAGAGTTSETQSYFFEDINMKKDITHFYRLRQIDFSGDFKISKTVPAKIKSDNLFIGEIYPNPTGNEFSINIKGDEIEYFELNIFDLFGRNIWGEKGELFSDNIRINVSDWSEGVYLVLLKINNEQYEKQLIIQR